MVRLSRPRAGETGSPQELTVERLGAQGDGIVMHDGRTIFVPFTLPEERVRVALEGGDRARVIERLSDAPMRVAPPCPHFTVCGGCATQHLAEDAYVRWKSDLLAAALRHRGLADATIGPLVRVLPGTRRRAEFAAIKDRQGLRAGFHAVDGRDVIDLVTCHVVAPELSALLPQLREFLDPWLPVGTAIDAHATLSESGIDLVLTGGPRLDLAAHERFVGFARSAGLARLSWRGMRRHTAEVIVQQRAPQVRIAGVAVDLPAGAFLQATAEGEAAIVAEVSRAVHEAGRIADLYSGCGAIALPLARQARVDAVEGAAEMAAALEAAARHSGLAGRLSASRRDLVRRPLTVEELAPYEAVVFDPPREGARAQAEALAGSRVPIVVGVSCDAGTFARDARILVDGGYRLSCVVPIDQFVWTPHLEMVGVFSR